MEIGESYELQELTHLRGRCLQSQQVLEIQKHQYKGWDNVCIVRILATIKNTEYVFLFYSRCGIRDCFRLSVAAYYNFPCALVEVWFCQLQIVLSVV